MTDRIAPERGVEAPVDCDRFDTLLPDYLESTLAPAARGWAEAHLTGCARCRALTDDLSAITRQAQALGPIQPERDLWAGIAARIETPVVSIGTTTGEHARVTQRRRKSAWIGLAAAGLVAATATATYQITKQSLNGQKPVLVATTTTAAPAAKPAAIGTLGSPVVDSGASAPVSGTTQAAAVKRAPAATSATVSLASNPTGKLSPAQTYDQEIARLRHVVDRRRNNLDSATVAVLEKNLHIIDEAIAQCKKALQQDPSSAYLNGSLNDALDNKVQLLRAAATLPSSGF